MLVASLHQAIADVLPTRLEFYENWLNAEGMREGRIGLAPLNAVLSFLRQEGEDTYAQITTRAGRYAAEWTVESMSPLPRKMLRAAPSWLRGHLVMSQLKRLVRHSYQASRVSIKLRRGTAGILLRSSIFCHVREPVSHRLCGFYAAASRRLLELFDLPARAEVTACRAVGESSCLLTVVLSSSDAP